MTTFKNGDILRCIEIPHWWNGYSNHKEGDLAVFEKYEKGEGGANCYNDWFLLHWSDCDEIADNRFLEKLDAKCEDGREIICFEFAYEMNTPKRQKEFLIENI